MYKRSQRATTTRSPEDDDCRLVGWLVGRQTVTKVLLIHMQGLRVKIRRYPQASTCERDTLRCRFLHSLLKSAPATLGAH